jgi:hypothetical protein
MATHQLLGRDGRSRPRPPSTHGRFKIVLASAFHAGRATRDRVLILGEAHLRAILTEYQGHYNAARPHQGIDQRTPDGDPDAFPGTTANLDSRRIRRKPVLNGLINEYQRAA